MVSPPSSFKFLHDNSVSNNVASNCCQVSMLFLFFLRCYFFPVYYYHVLKIKILKKINKEKGSLSNGGASPRFGDISCEFHVSILDLTLNVLEALCK